MRAVGFSAPDWHVFLCCVQRPRQRAGCGKLSTGGGARYRQFNGRRTRTRHYRFVAVGCWQHCRPQWRHSPAVLLVGCPGFSRTQTGSAGRVFARRRNETQHCRFGGSASVGNAVRSLGGVPSPSLPFANCLAIEMDSSRQTGGRTPSAPAPEWAERQVIAINPLKDARRS